MEIKKDGAASEGTAQRLVLLTSNDFGFRDEAGKIGTVICPKCKHGNNSDRSYCWWCRNALWGQDGGKIAMKENDSNQSEAAEPTIDSE